MGEDITTTVDVHVHVDGDVEVLAEESFWHACEELRGPRTVERHATGTHKVHQAAQGERGPPVCCAE
jgi:hypothetical protein